MLQKMVFTRLIGFFDCVEFGTLSPDGDAGNMGDFFSARIGGIFIFCLKSVYLS